MSAGKSAKKSAKAKKPKLVKRPNGAGALLSGGVPGNKGGTGRPPDEFKARMRELASAPAVERELVRVMKSARHREWMNALRYATEHGYGKAKEHVQVDVNDLAQQMEAARLRAKNR